LSVDVSAILERKYKYWLKALSDKAVATNINRAVDTLEFASYFSDIVISDTLFSSLTAIFTLGLSLSEIEPWNIAFKTALPSPEEFVSGVLLKVQRVGVDSIIRSRFPELQDVMLRSIYSAVDFLDTYLERPYSEHAKPPLTKAYYDQSRFGQSYYDPQAVREFFRSTLYAFTKKRGDIKTCRDRVKTATETLEITDELARSLFNRLSMASAVKQQALTWDYGWWDYSVWSREGSGGVVEYVDYDLNKVEVEYEDMIDVNACGHWDLYGWDLFYWCDVIHPYKLEPPSIVALAEALAEDFRRRYLSTPLLVANYQKAEERAEFKPSTRLELFALPLAQRQVLDNIVDQVVREKAPEAPPAKANMYRVAVYQLYSILSSTHTWGYEALKAMTPEELYQWWVSKWSSTGLDEGVLKELYSRVQLVLQTYARVRSTERVRALRRFLRLG